MSVSSSYLSGFSSDAESTDDATSFRVMDEGNRDRPLGTVAGRVEEIPAVGRDTPNAEAQEEGHEFPPIRHPEYQWVDREVGAYYSKYASKGALLNFLSHVKVSTVEGAEHVPFILRTCRQSDNKQPDWVFLRDEAEDFDYFFMYDRVISELHVTLAFDEFTMSVLRILNVAPTQLHPNVWDFIQAFKVLCLRFGIPPTVGLFLYHFCCRPRYPCRWVSLIRRPNCTLFKPFKSSFKKFKIGFFKVRIDAEYGTNYFFDSESHPLFPFHWRRNPLRYDEYPRSLLSASEQRHLDFLESLPRPIPVRQLVDLYKSPQPRADLEGIIQSLMAARKMEDLVKIKNMRKNLMDEGDRLAEATARATNDPSPRPPPRDVEIAEAERAKRGKGSKDRTHHRREKRRSPDRDEGHRKRMRQQQIQFAPSSSSSFFVPGFDPSKVIDSSAMSESVRDRLLSEPSASAWAEFCDFQARAFAIAHVLASNTASEATRAQRELEESRRDLAEALAANTSLTRANDDLRLQCLRLEKQVQAAEADRQKAEEESRHHALEAEKMSALSADLGKENLDLKKDVEELTAFIQKRAYGLYKDGFSHAIRQAGYFFGDVSKFNIDLDVHQGQLVPLDDIPDTPAAASSPGGEAETTAEEEVVVDK